MRLIRSIAFNAWFYGVTFVIVFDRTVIRPCRDWRAATSVARRWARLALAGLRVLCGVTWEVSGRENLPTEGPALIASMHQSAVDTMLWPLMVPEFAYVLKQELTRIPMFGRLLRESGMIVVDRSAGVAALRGMLRDAERAAAERRYIVIFPEGTRMPPGTPGRLQPGIVALSTRLGLPIIPVTLDSGLYWGRRAFRKSPGVIHLRIHPALPAGLSRDDVLARLGRIFAEASSGAASPVDNSVEPAAPQFANERS